jgi:hypothetical protein
MNPSWNGINSDQVSQAGSCFQNLLQKLFFGIRPIKVFIQYPILVRIIPFVMGNPVLYQAGEEVCRIWENYRAIRGNLHKPGGTVFQRFGTMCPANGCGQCELDDCFFSEFIHQYWDCPHGN